MPYLVCDNCDIFYEVTSIDENINLKSCECGNELIYCDSLKEYFINKGKIIKPYYNLLASYESSISRIIIFCIKESPPLGLEHIIDVLQGTDSDFLNNHKLKTLLSYSILSNFSKIYLKEAINKLIDKSFLKIERNNSENLLHVTKSGLNFLNDNQVIYFDIINQNIKNKTISPKKSFDLPQILINDPSKTKRAHVAYLLGETKDPKYVNVLCEATKDKDGNVRRLSASALGKIGDNKAVATLINLLKDPKPQVRQYAVRSLGKLESKESIDQFKEMVNDDSPYVVQEVKKILTRQNNSEISIDSLDPSELIPILLNDVDNGKRARAAYLLGETRDNLYADVLCDATSDHNGNVRRLAASALGKIGDKRSTNALIKLLKDPKPQVRQYAVKALGKIESQNITKNETTKEPEQNLPASVIKSKDSHLNEEEDEQEDIVRVLLNDRKENNRAQAAYNLGAKKDPKYVDALCKATKDESANVRRLSIVSLGKIGDKTAENTFIKLLKDPDPYTRQYAIIGLDKIDSKKAIPHIKKLYDDPVSYVRDTAFKTVSKLYNN